jgi:hypothetical protein
VFDASEAAIYDSREKRSEYRVTTSLADPLWTGAFDRDWTFQTERSIEGRWFYSSVPEPVVAPPDSMSFGALLIREYGLAPWETVITRPGIFPRDPSLGFTLRIDAKFPQTGPTYGWTNQIVAGSLDGSRGKLSDPLRIVYRGDDSPPGAGEISIRSGAFAEIHSFVNDGASHRYELIWNPDATMTPGDELLTIKLDTVTVFEVSPGEGVTEPAGFDPTDPLIVRPWFVQIGVPTIPKDSVTPIGTPEEPAVMIAVERITVTALDGYEVRTWPVWTSAGGSSIDLDDAEPGQRITLGTTETWAIVPHVAEVSTAKGRDGTSDEFTVRLRGGVTDGPINLFADDEWARRVLLIDSRVIAGDVPSAWKRRLVGLVEDVEQRLNEDGTIDTILSGRDLVSARLDTNMLRAYVFDDPEAGEVDAENIGYSYHGVLHDLFEVSDHLWGVDPFVTETLFGFLGHRMSLPSMKPMLDTGDASMLSVITEIADDLGLEVWRHYDTDAYDSLQGFWFGTARYGELMVGRWNPGAGDPVYTFRGRGHVAAGPENVMHAIVRESIIDNPGQVAPTVDGFGIQASQLSGADIGPGNFPSAPYPPDMPEMGTSVSADPASAFAMTTIGAADARDILDAIPPAKAEGFAPLGFRFPRFHPGGEYVAALVRAGFLDGGPFYAVYEWDNATRTIGAEVATIAATLNDSGALAWSEDGAYLFTVRDTSPFVEARAFDAGTGTLTATPVTAPASPPPGRVQDVRVSPDGAHVALAHVGSPFLTVINWTGSAWGSTWAAPADVSGITGQGNRIAWHPGGEAIVLTHQVAFTATHSVHAWRVSGAAFGARYADAPHLGNLPTVNDVPFQRLFFGVDWNPNGRTIALGNDSTTDRTTVRMFDFTIEDGWGAEVPRIRYYFDWMVADEVRWSANGRYLAVTCLQMAIWSPVELYVVEIVGDPEAGIPARMERVLYPRDGSPAWWNSEWVDWHPDQDTLITDATFGQHLSVYEFKRPLLHRGGPGVWRWWRENAERRRVTLTVEHHDWIEPSDEIVIDAPGLGLGDGETWVVSTVRETWDSDGKMEAVIEAVTADVVRAIARGV